ncbi:hypothetical protein [Moorena producens]|uniref:hypothetical protein n=1 Tax=Moorena producens TaxID=1155739 RepID=UPI003C743EE8
MKTKSFLEKFSRWFFSHEENLANVNVNEGWTLTLTGEITEISKLNVDKSGRNPKYLIYGSIDLEKYSLQGAKFPIPSLVHFKGKEKDIFKQVRRELVVGDRVTLCTRGLDAPVDRFVIQN